MRHQFKTRDTCSTKISFELNEGKLHQVSFTGGCNGNLKAISTLVEGKDAKEIAALLKGNTCGFKSTSCADQLAMAIEEALEKERQAE